MRWIKISLVVMISVIVVVPRSALAEQGRLGKRVAQLEAQVAALEEILQFVRVESEPINGLAGPHWIVEGANVHVRSGSGSTHGPCLDPSVCADSRGLGNLVVGYNEGFPSQARVRRGTHNLVVGSEHAYLGSGGFVAGHHNSLRGQGASVTGGAENKAFGENASICGGELNVASGMSSSVGGGLENLARGDFSLVGGGSNNVAKGESSSVSGGSRNVASGPRSSVSGGAGRIAPTDDDWAAGSLLEED